ncbi:MAG: UvrD-helicase domain-containing protein [Acidobacteriia bacterium]|nr:UvrD-helicase domain-containing protein [Terriglobia bacterium]
MSALLDGLNPAQVEAVTCGGGPILVLAGAGSGKTRVITHRIAHLVLEVGVDPSRIVAVTFTNKAAGEMRTRVARLLGDAALPSWIGTFHALCLRILRRDGRRIGLDPGFVVYDADDQLAVVRRILRDESSDDAPSSARPVLSKISRAKNAMVTPPELAGRAFSPEARLAARAYALYEERLKRASAVDFDDLLLRALELLTAAGEAPSGYAERCEHLLVDEYQDTNRPQYGLVNALSAVHGNVCVVGDEDQSIYRFRGADIRNILDFERDHKGARVVRLEENYRSTGTILDAAGAVVARNRNRKGKSLWTRNARGEPLEVYHAADDRSEARWIARRIAELLPGRAHEDFAVLYRTNAQSRLIEEFLRADRLPYQVVGSVRFYERKEVKDLLAYLKLAANPGDDVSFRRIVNAPPRGIGDATLEVVEGAARSRGVPLGAAAALVLGEGLASPRAARPLRSFLDLVLELTRLAEREPAVLLLEKLVSDLGYADYLARSHPGEGADRMDNVRALISAAAEYQEETGEGRLQGFLDRSALVSDADEVGARPGITLMTVHCAKGLEFPVVFLAGLEENLFPHSRSRDSDDELEEERRLCYVAMTRARERLLLSRAEVRRIQGEPVHAGPSRFLFEIPSTLLREAVPKPWDRLADGGPERTYRGTAFGGSSAARAASRPRAAEPTAVAPRHAGPPPEDGFAVGAIVAHPKFGSGRIVDREGMGKTLKLTIHFAGQGSKKILPAYTTLEVVSR